MHEHCENLKVVPNSTCISDIMVEYYLYMFIRLTYQNFTIDTNARKLL